jgi:gliding motility-associated-like protein
VYEISVYGIDGFGCMTDTSYMTVKTEACNRLYIPNSFTPNNDKSNDVFGVFGSGVYEPKLRVYNKWGFCVFNSDSGSSHWTGSDGSGYYCPDGVYYWTLNYRDTYGFNRNEQGHVTLIR